MKKKIFGFLLGQTLSVGISSTQAAVVQSVWQPLNQELSTYSLRDGDGKQLQQRFSTNLNNNYQLKLVNETDSNKIKHHRFQIHYKGLRVWGHHVIIHQRSKMIPLLTGSLVKDIEQDLTSIVPQISADQVLEQAINNSIYKNKKVEHKQIEKIIYIDGKSQKATLAYLVSFFCYQPIAKPSFIIDANTGDIIKKWNDLRTIKKGIGPGGNTYSSLPAYQYVLNPTKPNEFPAFQVKVNPNNNNCRMESESIRILDFNRKMNDFFLLPISKYVEGKFGYPKTYSYPCFNNDKLQQRVNYPDGNIARGPNNDAQFFAHATLELFKAIGIDNPLGTDLPLRIYTRVRGYDNAFATPTSKNNKNKIYIHQQIVLGDGKSDESSYYDYSLTQETVAHELCHNVSTHFSDLEYIGQVGGINEAFSDMCAVALNAFLSREGYTWYWKNKRDGYVFGLYESSIAEPLRYLYNPPLDGYSIGSANRFKSHMDPHYSSGVFNKAYYLIAFKYRIGPVRTFKLFALANQNYWTPLINFNNAACGVIQSAKEDNLSTTKVNQVRQAFAEIGVRCNMPDV